MAFEDLPDVENEYVPTPEDEVSENPDTDLDPDQVPDDSETVDQPDEPDAEGEVAEGEAEDPEGMLPPGIPIDAALPSDPLFAEDFPDFIPFEGDPELELVDSDDGDVYSVTTGSPTDEEWDAVTDGSEPPTIARMALASVDDQPEDLTGSDFETEALSASVADGDADLDAPTQYEIQGKPPTGEWKTLATVPASQVDAEVSGLPTQEKWLFRVRAHFSNGEVGDWSAESAVDLPKDMLAPPVPSMPTVTGRMGVAVVTWDGKGVGAVEQPADYKHTVVWHSLTGFVGSWNNVGVVHEAGQFHVSNIPYGQLHYFSLSSLDNAGNESGRSISASVMLMPLVDEDSIKEALKDTQDQIDAASKEIADTGAELDRKLTIAEAEIARSKVAIEKTLPGAIDSAKAAADMALLIAPISTAAPTVADGKGRPKDALWTRIDASGSEIGYWRWTGVAWIPQALSTTVIPKLAASWISSGVVDTDRLNAREIAASTATFQQVDVKNLFATTGTMSEAVIDKLFTDVVRSRKLTTDMLLVGRGENLFVDPSQSDEGLRNFRASWSNSQGTDAGWYWAGSYFYSRANVADGAYGFRMRNSTSGSQYDEIDVKVGTTYRLRWEAFISGAGATATTNAAALMRHEDGTTSFSAITSAQALKSGWNELDMQWEVPATVVSCGVVFSFGGVTKATRLALRNPHMQPMSDASVIVDGAVVARHITASESLTAKVAQFLEITAGMLKANSVTADAIAAGSVTAIKLQSDSVTAIKIAADAVTASKLHADAINGKTITGAILQTVEAANRGIKISNALGITAYSSSGARTVHISPTTGNVRITGGFHAGAEDDRGVSIDPSTFTGAVHMRLQTGALVPGSTTLKEAGHYGVISDNDAWLPRGSLLMFSSYGHASDVDQGRDNGTIWASKGHTGMALRDSQSRDSSYMRLKAGDASLSSSAVDGQRLFQATDDYVSARYNDFIRVTMSSTASHMQFGNGVYLTLASGAARMSSSSTPNARLFEANTSGIFAQYNENIYTKLLATSARMQFGSGVYVNLSSGAASMSSSAVAGERTFATNTTSTYMAHTGGAILSMGSAGTVFDANGTMTLRPAGGSNTGTLRLGYAQNDVHLAPALATSTAASNLYYSSSTGQVFRSTSRRDQKILIEDMERSVIESALLIRPRTWFDKTESENLAARVDALAHDEAIVDEDGNTIHTISGQLKRVPGVVVEELLALGLEQFIFYGEDADGNAVPEGVMYDRLAVTLFPVIAELRERVKSLELALA